MLLKVKKQIEETIEVKTPAYYKSSIGYNYLTITGHLVYVNSSMISLMEPSESYLYKEEIARVVGNGKPCTKEEFDKAYADTSAKLDIAAGAVLF